MFKKKCHWCSTFISSEINLTYLDLRNVFLKYFCVCVHARTRARACGFALAGFSNFIKCLPKIILGQFNSAVPCKYRCSIWLEDLLKFLKFLTCLVTIKLIFFWDGGGIVLQFLPRSETAKFLLGHRLSQGACDVLWAIELWMLQRDIQIIEMEEMHRLRVYFLYCIKYLYKLFCCDRP